MKYLSCILIIILVTQHVNAQQANSDGTNSTADAIFIVVRDYPHGAIKLQLFDPSTGIQNDYLDLRQVGYQIPQVALGQGGKYVFSLEVKEGGAYLPALNFSRIVKIDPTSKKRVIVYSRKNMVYFTFSPNDSKILVKYYPDEVTVIDRSTVGLGQWCVVNLKINSDSCEVIPFPDKFYLYDVRWISNKKLAYISEKEDSVRVLDADNLTRTADIIALPQGFFADRLLSIPDSEKILVNVSQLVVTGKCEIISLDVNSKKIQSIADLPCSSVITFLSLSPDTRTLIVGYAGGKIPSLVIDFSTGKIIKEVTNMLDMEWGNIQWLHGRYVPFAIGQLYYNGKPIATAIFDPLFDNTLSVAPITQDEVILVPS